MSITSKIALGICIIGGINWGSIGLFDFDIVAGIFGGADSVLSRIIYTLVGISALWCISFFSLDNEHPKNDRTHYINEESKS